MDDLSDGDSYEEFGPFAAVFRPLYGQAAPYLSLLRCMDSVDRLIAKIRDLSATEDAAKFAAVLLRDVNWRPHLVGAVASYFLRSAEVSDQLWRTVDAGSWVTPQLVVILSLSDSQFLERSLDRLEAGCPCVDDRAGCESEIESHIARGPATDEERCSKAASALWAIVSREYIENPRTVRLSANPSLHSLISTDVDNGGEIALDWRSAFLEAVEVSKNM